MGLLTGLVGSVLKTLVLSFVSERIILTVAVGLLEKLAKSTKNTIDDKVVTMVKESLSKKMGKQ